MMTAQQFENNIRKVTNKGFGSGFKKAGRTAVITEALRAYEESVAASLAQADQAAYLYQVVKDCNTWLALKKDKTGGNTGARMDIIAFLRLQALHTLTKDYPLVQQALDRYQAKKNGAAANPAPRPATPLHGVYAHEGTAYGARKAQGQFRNPGQFRFAPSATLMDGAYGTVRGGHAKYSGKEFHDLTYAEYIALDRLLGMKCKVLYLSKIQRLNYMADVENGLFVKATDSSVVHMPGTTVGEDLGKGSFQSDTKLYACDTAGNLFITDGDIRDRKNRAVQVNHSTLLAGKEVLCAGTISIKNGRLRGISNQSGHYKPDTNALTQMVRELQNQGVQIRGIIVSDMVLQQETEGELYLQGRYGQFPVFWRGKPDSVLNSKT
jgi:hypothetical protein